MESQKLDWKSESKLNTRNESYMLGATIPPEPILEDQGTIKLQAIHFTKTFSFQIQVLKMLKKDPDPYEVFPIAVRGMKWISSKTTVMA